MGGGAMAVDKRRFDAHLDAGCRINFRLIITFTIALVVYRGEGDVVVKEGGDVDD